MYVKGHVCMEKLRKILSYAKPHKYKKSSIHVNDDKKFACLFSAIFILCLTSNRISRAQPILEDVVGMCLFDEGRGKDVRDASGNGLHGEFRRKPEFVEGKFGTVLQFSGGAEGPWLEMDGPTKIDSVDFSFAAGQYPTSRKSAGQRSYRQKIKMRRTSGSPLSRATV